MKKLITHLRARPKEDRQLVAMLASGAVMGILLLGWGISMSGFFARANESQTAASAQSVSQ